jgi:hypothetical protein
MHWTSWQEMCKFQDKVFSFLESIPFNSDNYVIDDICKAESKTFFIETVKEYMRIHIDDYMGYISINDNYSVIRKTFKIIK